MTTKVISSPNTTPTTIATTTINTFVLPATSRSDSRTQLFDLRGGYDFFAGGITLGPRFGFALRHTNLDRFIENGNTPRTLRFNKQREKSQLGSLGVQASKAFGLSPGVINLQVNVDWLHEFKDDQRIITASFAEDLRSNPTQLQFLNQAPDRNWFNVRVATAAVFPGGLNAFVSFEHNLGHDYLDQYGISFGLRQEL